MTTLKERMKALPLERRKKVEERAKVLIAREKSFRETAGVREAAPENALWAEQDESVEGGEWQFDLSNFNNLNVEANQFGKQIDRLKEKGFNTDRIEDTVDSALRNLSEPDPSPFIIYGEPQSGKTEMMICLTARLLDEGHEFIVLLLNDSIDLLSQNLGRFQSSGLAPSPHNFSEILDPDHRIEGIKHVVFCKKNAKDLEKLIDKIDTLRKVVVIDDEADYATPNAKINQKQRTKINELIGALLGAHGIYIGVTATPARLDLNNTFGNVSAKWVEFRTHEKYTGQDHFFPVAENIGYRLNLLPEEGDEPRYTREALFSFLVATAQLNNTGKPDNYSMLVHTSGKVDDHQKDKKEIEKTITALMDQSSSKYQSYVKDIWDKAKERYPKSNPNSLTDFVLKNISRHKLIVLNSKRDVSVSGNDATHPKSLFTIVIGGNIVSRGVTLNNLLSMYFTRDVKHKIQQDTYIQRARMFGLRGDYLKHFELSIPLNLYNDWHRCFVYHKLSLDGARRGNAPIWITDKRVSAVAGSSIDKVNIYHTKRGELSFGLFTENLTDAIEISNDANLKPREKLQRIKNLLPETSFPEHLVQFVKTFAGSDDGERVAVYEPMEVSTLKPDPNRDDDIENISRSRGFWGQFDRDKEPSAVHHFRIFHYKNRRGKLFYKYDCDDIRSLNFLLNVRNCG
ncbi:MAG: DEAD/DEAH box helicase family protein [Candidatus Dadabacteria bacterium]|nr:DEAD/DEAH box helicase family protein [Candidatus Dadabacteria bacterium]